MCPSVPALFNKLSWIPFYEEAKVCKCVLAYKRISHEAPEYFINRLTLNGKGVEEGP